MKIEKSTLSLSSSHELTRSYEKTEDLHAWNNRTASGTAEGDEAVISPQGKALSSSAAGDGGDDTTIHLERKYLVLAQLIANLTGRDVKIFHASKGSKGADGGWSVQPEGTGAAGSTGWGVRYTSTETYTENENTGFSAQGTVTANGKEYGFNVSLLMERSFSVSESVDLRAGDALKDPLAINFGQGPVGLSGQKVKFDINMDGSKEDMPLLSGGSGFLAFDRNGNGTIDNGSELFGPSTGNGFQELAALDEDKNGWIDEGDSAYGQLRIWVKNGDRESLETLKGLDIGAICTEGASTPFEIKNSVNETEAKIRETGVYLREDGSAGTVQRLDLAI